MKKILFLLVVVIGIFYFWPNQLGSGIQKIKASLAGILSTDSSSSSEKVSDQDYLAAKQQELKAYEDGLKHFDTQIEQWRIETESKICPQTGRPGVFILKDDPRPSLREKIDKVRQEIAELERKVNK